MAPSEEHPSPGEELVDLIDRDDRVIGRASRRRVRAENLLHRGVGILCRNSGGLIYVHKRTDIKDVFPGMYDMFVGGVVEAGETYDEAASRERRPASSTVRAAAGIFGSDSSYRSPPVCGD